MHCLLILVILFGFAGCGKDEHSKKSPAADPRIQELQERYKVKLADAEAIRDHDTGWLSRQDCDGMIWAGEYAASIDVKDVNIEAAEYAGSPGKFGRRPEPRCWTQDGGDQGSATEWSRDMFTAGLLPYAWVTGRRDILERHAAYGRANNWMMGEPLADGRTIYTPALIGLLYKAIYGLKGDLDTAALWPDVFPSGLVDYQAHLQIMSIWVQGEIADRLGDGDAKPQDTPDDHRKKYQLVVSNTMYDRLKEHAGRQPKCPLYQAVYGMYSGDMGPALDSLLGTPECDYLRCPDNQCFLADWLFSASLTIRHFQGH